MCVCTTLAGLNRNVSEWVQMVFGHADMVRGPLMSCLLPAQVVFTVVYLCYSSTAAQESLKHSSDSGVGQGKVYCFSFTLNILCSLSITSLLRCLWFSSPTWLCAICILLMSMGECVCMWSAAWGGAICSLREWGMLFPKWNRCAFVSLTSPCRY